MRDTVFGDTVFGDTVFGDTVFGDTVLGNTVLSYRARVMLTRARVALFRPCDDGRPPSEAQRSALSIPPERHTMSRARAGCEPSIIVRTMADTVSRSVGALSSQRLLIRNLRGDGVREEA